MHHELEAGQALESVFLEWEILQQFVEPSVNFLFLGNLPYYYQPG